MKTTAPKGDVPHSDLPGDQAARVYAEGFVESESRIEGSSPRENLVLWIGLLGTAIIWFIQLECNYALVPWTCSTGNKWALYVSSLISLVCGAVPGWIAWKCWNSVKQGKGTDRESTSGGRRRFMALAGILMSGLFFLLIFAQAIPHFFINPCLE
jgi:hypothetical protein